MMKLPLQFVILPNLFDVLVFDALQQEQGQVYETGVLVEITDCKVDELTLYTAANHLHQQLEELVMLRVRVVLDVVGVRVQAVERSHEILHDGLGLFEDDEAVNIPGIEADSVAAVV